MVVGELKEVNERLEKVEDQIVKNNAGLNKVRLSVMRLADKLDKQDEVEKRVSALEKVVFK